jgi:VWFA-related protein
MILSLCVGAFSQSLSPATFLADALPNATGTTISKRVDEVNLAFTVTDKKGRLINNLNPDDFTILDNHLAPQGVNFFQQQTDLPLRVAVLVDASDSILYRFDYEKVAAVMFLKRILRPGKDQAFVASFNDRVRLAQDDTDDSKQLSTAVKRMHAGGNTALYDAIVFGSNKLRNSPPQTRLAIILISDGEDTSSKSHLFDAQQAAIQAEVTLFALSTNEFPGATNSAGEAVLNRLSETTGGVILPARDEYHLGRAFHKVEQILRSQYAVAYRPAQFAPDGSFRLVELFPLRKGLKVQCRRGYYARQESSTMPSR